MNETGAALMVKASGKRVTEYVATATVSSLINSETFKRNVENSPMKGSESGN